MIAAKFPIFLIAAAMVMVSSFVEAAPAAKPTSCIKCLAPPMCPPCGTGFKCVITPATCHDCGKGECKPAETQTKPGHCIYCFAPPTCPPCGEDEKCVIIPATCHDCGDGYCTPK
ncbi:hypothetical protein BX616_003355 [Lobosporangium transversale]|uniref:Membrane anchor Opy2 N-terminal domain-containing protein n=1 Tax=Lobosporangium transversale TaxID=64571 RepID=A0A1Y2GP48_9FUNG|nr:hypothetical protein BCR41DRAFT_353417 [Lobosporangium transversale]KAF9899024.1 hypothetical protein BX616_003355 [Lobosporangium transversale]ORZ16035.1 hypothetical protein BCR41DRAFT_353417 [Lobosporangium transversale]|eukprot:XP_021881382.1 hypothetical protein BCR41DRAFT_353417 [Lobosporangium transversale]